MTEKSSESFKEYAQRWQQTASQVQPALTKKENVTIFMSILSATYYNRLIGYASASFTNLVQMGERIEDGLKKEKIKDYQTLFASLPWSRRFHEKDFPGKRNDKSEKKVHVISSQTPKYHQPVYIPPSTDLPTCCTTATSFGSWYHVPSTTNHRQQQHQ